jgi:hypothetical protein
MTVRQIIRCHCEGANRLKQSPQLDEYQNLMVLTSSQCAILP